MRCPQKRDTNCAFNYLSEVYLSAVFGGQECLQTEYFMLEIDWRGDKGSCRVHFQPQALQGYVPQILLDDQSTLYQWRSYWWIQLHTVSLLSRSCASTLSRFCAWLPMRFCDAIDKKCTMSASYPNVSIRASGMSLGKIASGQKTWASLSVQVVSRLPVRPWTNITLSDRFSIFILREERFPTHLLNYGALWIMTFLQSVSSLGWISRFLGHGDVVISTSLNQTLMQFPLAVRIVEYYILLLSVSWLYCSFSHHNGYNCGREITHLQISRPRNYL